MQPVLRVGLTGGIGSGKSTVCRIFTDLGVPVIDADEIARQLTGPDQPALRLIAEAFGANALTASGELNRGYLRSMVFNDDTARTRLEDILHPLIYKEIERRIKLLDHPYCIICIPLLIEKHPQNKVDRVLVIDAPEEQQILRACKRDHTDRINIIRIMRAQTTRANRLAEADDIIHNDGDMASLQSQIIMLHSAYNKIASGRNSLDTPGN
jgi:dephospho-CoA kinase